MSQPKTYHNVGGQLIDSASVEKPSNRRFRDDWQYDGKVITVNMDSARMTHRDRLRDSRKKEFEKNDIAINDAILSVDPVAKAAAIARRDQLRNVTIDPRIEAAATPEELNNLTLDTLAPSV